MTVYRIFQDLLGLAGSFFFFYLDSTDVNTIFGNHMSSRLGQRRIEFMVQDRT